MVRKTFFFSALLIMLVTVISFAILYFAMPDYYLQKKQQNLQANLNTLVTQLQQAADRDECADLIAAFVQNNNTTAVAFDADGALIAELSSPLVSLAGGEDNAYFAMYSYGAVDDNGDTPPVTFTIRALPQKLELPGMQQRTFVARSDFISGNVINLSGAVNTAILSRITINGTLQPIGEAKGVILSLMPYALLAGVILGLLLSWVYARQISQPILRISAAAQHMQLLEPQALSNIRSRDEVGLLSQNLDSLYASLRANIAQLQEEMAKVNRLERAKTELMQSASHELKTPIAALSGMLEGMIDNIGVYHNKEKYLLECKGQVDKLTALVAEILNASQADSAQTAARAETDINELISQVLADHAIAIDSKELRLSVQLAPVTMLTDPGALYRVLTNLIGNAARHTPPCGEIHIDLNEAQLSIENQCPPIPEEELPKLFEPFYTLSYSRGEGQSGAGLGLHIVKRNLAALNIPYSLENTELGLKITLFFSNLLS